MSNVHDEESSRDLNERMWVQAVSTVPAVRSSAWPHRPCMSEWPVVFGTGACQVERAPARRLEARAVVSLWFLAV